MLKNLKKFKGFEPVSKKIEVESHRLTKISGWVEGKLVLWIAYSI
jgi:hypothetical protein